MHPYIFLALQPDSKPCFVGHCVRCPWQGHACPVPIEKIERPNPPPLTRIYLSKRLQLSCVMCWYPTKAKEYELLAVEDTLDVTNHYKPFCLHNKGWLSMPLASYKFCTTSPAESSSFLRDLKLGFLRRYEGSWNF
ncbi:hypothetical protein Pyn_41082 [Prunus yedoensis var. nudiflora]|uniref:Uncharacterized protein n=1 Tax=Prunus yedoensis var. nudiflora TaxID=2094558 RepID=A0A314UTF6_PRUYE|nr:hypothetical protein Pyn_41082 [Prunus yedoensis var. nudiflora]